MMGIGICYVRSCSGPRGNHQDRSGTLLYFVSLLVLVLLILLMLRWKLGYFGLSKRAVEAAHQLVHEHIRLGNWEQATKDIQPLLQRDRSSASHLLYAQVLRGMQDYDQALEVLGEAEFLHEGDLRVLQQIGKTYLEMDQVAEAVCYLEQSRTVLRDEEDVLDLATAYYLTDRVVEAWSLLEDRAMKSSSGRLLALAGDCHFFWQNYRLAVSFYQQAQHYGWMNQRTLSRTGHSLSCTGKFFEAERYFREVLRFDGSDVFSTLGLGLCLERRGLFKRALMVYQSGEAWDSGDPYILRQAGICSVYSGQHHYAELYLTEAIKGGAKSPQAMAFLGYSLECQKRWREAEAVYCQLVEDFPEHVAGYRALAWLYGVGLSSSISDSKGLALARQAVDMLPDNVSWELLSACEARSGNFDRAHSIQEHLWAQATDKDTRLRLRHAMRTLRKGQPLDEQQVCRALVA